MTVVGDVTLISLLLLVITVQARHTIRMFNVGSAFSAQKTRKEAWIGAVLIITWYWIGVLFLYLVDGFTLALIPDLESLIDIILGFITGSLTNPILALLFAGIGALSMWLLEALFFIRRILIYIYMYGMPFAFALSFGNIPIISSIASGFSKKFFPLAIAPIPATILLRGYELLTSPSILDPSTLFLKYLVVVSLPVLIIWITWKTFTYASPLTTKVLGTAATGAATLGAVATGAYVASPYVGLTAARWGPTAAASHALADRIGGNRSDSGETTADTQPNDNTVTDAYGQQGVPAYRRTENDPGYY